MIELDRRLVRENGMVWDKLTDVLNRTQKLEARVESNDSMLRDHDIGLAAANQRIDAIFKYVNETAEKVTAYSDENASRL